jgi:hypothetical protein
MMRIIFRKNIVWKMLLQINPHKSSGPDSIPPIVLKTFARELAPILTKIFYLSYKKGVFPTIWKQANVQPVSKKGHKDDPSNYKPISILSVVANVFEKQINHNIISYLKKSKLSMEGNTVSNKAERQETCLHMLRMSGTSHWKATVKRIVLHLISPRLFIKYGTTSF